MDFWWKYFSVVKHGYFIWVYQDRYIPLNETKLNHSTFWFVWLSTISDLENVDIGWITRFTCRNYKYGHWFLLEQVLLLLISLGDYFCLQSTLSCIFGFDFRR